jgi:hypothetical protein
MKRSVIGVVVSVLTLVASCSSKDTPSTSSTAADSGASGSRPEGATADSGTEKGVECTHPGAGKPIGGDRCECSTTRNIAGEWSTKRTCREGDLCPSRDKDETIVFAQNGTSVRADKGDTYSMTGTLCGDVLLWSGGPKDGLNPECGQIRFTDDSQYVTDSCFVASGACSRTYGEGCPSLKGQCTGTGAKKPESAAAVKRVICN